MSLLKATDLSRYYEVGGGVLRKAQTLKALDGVSLELEPGKTLAVVGESGCGKSTLARIVTMIEPATSGDLLIDGRPARMGDVTLRKIIQIVFQDPYGSLNPRHKIGQILGEPLLLNTDLGASERRRKADEMMERVGLRSEHNERYPHMFSGGQRQRIAVARALMLEPKILVLDEPVSALDLSIQAQVLNILTELQDDLGLAYLFISHDLSVVRHIADEIMVMYLGRTVEAGPANAIMDDSQHPYTRALISATPVADPGRKTQRIMLTGELPSPLDPPKGCPFHPRCAHVTAACSRETPVLSADGARLLACYNPLSG